MSLIVDVDRQSRIVKLLEAALGETSFEIRWCSDPWCQFMKEGPARLHLVDQGGWNYVAQVALHEAAHLLMGRGGHDIAFWDLFEGLLARHLDQSLNAHQHKMKNDYLQPEVVIEA